MSHHTNSNSKPDAATKSTRFEGGAERPTDYHRQQRPIRGGFGRGDRRDNDYKYSTQANGYPRRNNGYGAGGNNYERGNQQMRRPYGTAAGVHHSKSPIG